MCFLAGLAAIYLSLASPLDSFASFLLTAHMAHGLLTMVAPPLLLLLPQLPLLRARRLVTRVLGPFLLWPLLRSFLHRLMHPVVCWVLFVLSNVLWHVPDFYELALRSPGWHKVEHFCFLATALLFWWHVVQPWPSHPYWPRWTMIPYLLLADLQNTALGGFLSFYDRVAYLDVCERTTFRNRAAQRSGDRGRHHVGAWIDRLYRAGGTYRDAIFVSKPAGAAFADSREAEDASGNLKAEKRGRRSISARADPRRDDSLAILSPDAADRFVAPGAVQSSWTDFLDRRSAR